jgi:gliding motility-associated-like protein
MLLIIAIQQLSAQPCANDYFSMGYQGGKPNSVSRSAVNSSGETFMAGEMSPGGGNSFSNGWVTKCSKNGTVLWSKRYAAEGFNSFSMRNIAAMPDGGCMLLMGSFFIDASQSQVTDGAVVAMCCDRYGNINWTKRLPGGRITDYNTLTQLPGGDFLISGTTGFFDPDKFSTCNYIRLQPDGTTRWSNKLQSNEYLFGISTNSSAMVRSNGTAVYVTRCLKMNASWSDYFNAAFFMVSLNLNTGQVVWKKYFNSVNIPVSILYRLGPAVAVYEKPNGDIAFTASISETIPIPDPPGFRKTIEVVCDGLGNLKEINTFYNGQPGVRPIASVTGAQQQAILLDDGQQPVLMRLDGSSTVTLQKEFGAVPGQEAAALSFYNSRYTLFTSDRIQNLFVRMIQTDAAGNAPCEETPAEVIKETPGNILAAESSFMFEAPEGPVTLPVITGMWIDYPLQTTVECRVNCCPEIKGPVVTTELCNQTSYTLPNGDVVKDSGTYYQTLTSAAGCDSIAYHRILFSKTPVADVEPIVCLEGQDTLLLEAPGGYPVYNWMNGQGNGRRFAVTKPGSYTVTVSNGCGSATGTIEVLDKCDVTILMPSGFTPNGDGVNDIFLVPPQNRGKLLRFEIFNRWGQRIFIATEAVRGWNGQLGSKPAPPGTYVYTVVMTSPNGKTTRTQRGWVVLMR